jgi:transposase
MMMRQRPPGSLPLRARKDHLSHAHALREIDAVSGDGASGGRRPTVVPAPDAADAELSARLPAGRSPPATSCASWPTSTGPRWPAGSARSCVARASTPQRLYSSTLSDWRRQRDAGAFGALTPARRGPKVDETNPLTAKVVQLQKDNARLVLRLTRAEAIIIMRPAAR